MAKIISGVFSVQLHSQRIDSKLCQVLSIWGRKRAKYPGKQKYLVLLMRCVSHGCTQESSEQLPPKSLRSWSLGTDSD